MTPEDRERVLKKVEADFSTRQDLSTILLEDFIIHLGVTTTSLLLTHLIQSAKTPEEKEAIRAIPEEIIVSWEKSRTQEFAVPDNYTKILSEKGKDLFTPEDIQEIQEIAKGFAAADVQAVAQVAARLREGFKKVRDAL